MKLAKSRLTAQGQISVPAEVRRRLELAPGSVLEWDAEADRITVRRAGKHSSEDIHQVLFPQPPKAKSLVELKTGIRRRLRKKYARH